MLLATASAAALLAATPEVYARPLGGYTPSPSAAAVAAAQSGQQEAARAARAASNSLRRATLAIQSMQATQQAARDAARAALNAMPNIVPNGLRPGGLQIGTGVVGADGSVNTNLWQGANLPTQFTDGDRTKVGIKQTQQKAILTWDTFNVGGKTDLTFDQQGNRSWVALNRVLGNDGRPSQILGNIKADGSVYVINQNGIIFGGASQVNVGALIASTARISNEQFLSGIYSTQTGSTWNPSFTDAGALLGNGTGGGVVKVQAGAQIATHAPASVTAGGGFVMLLGGQVENAGAINTPKGQALLAAGDDFVLRRGYGTDANVSSTTRGNEIATLFDAGSLAGLVRNSGIIFSPQGDITLAGRTIEQNGILVASTSVNSRGTIHLLNSATDTLGSITLGADSVTTIIPELESSETALNSQRDALIKASDAAKAVRAQSATGAFDNLSLLADRLDQSRIEIVTGGNVLFKGGAADAGSLTIAQGGQVAVSAGGRIFTESGSTIDVSGVRDVVLAMSANNIMINIQGNELRDSPGNRDNNYLKNANVWVDIRDLIFVPSGTGGYQGDRYYTPGGLLEVGGYLANTAHKIGEWSAVGGTITLSAPEVIAQQGSIFDISGGSVRYESGNIRTTNFLGKDGRLYNVNDARGDMMFYGLGTGFIRPHQRWGVTEVWTNPFGKGRESVRWEEGYTVGRDAGKLVLSTPTAIFEGKILADTVTGERQVNARPAGVTDGYKLAPNTAALKGQLALGAYGALTGEGVFNSDVRFGNVASITGGLNATEALTSDRANTAWFDTTHINALGLGGLDIGTTDTITIESALTLADGGQINFNAAVVDIKANITARSGSLTVSNVFKGGVGRGNGMVLVKNGASSVNLHEGVTLDLRGLWVNALLNPADGGKLAYLNGGSVSLKSTHDVTLKSGSVIDVSSGGAVLANAKVKGGRGGDVTLIADQENSQVQPDGLLTLNGNIRGYGVSGGGTLKIESGTAIGIGGKVLATDGVLGAGEKTSVDVVLTEDYLVLTGSTLPVSYTYSVSLVKPGERLGGVPVLQRLTLAADWTPPRPSSGYYFLRFNGSDTYIHSDQPIPTIPAGTVIDLFGASSSFPTSYVVEGSVFPNGLSLQSPKTVTLNPGAVSPVDFTVPKGTVIQAGISLTRDVAVAPTSTLQSSLFQSGFSSYDVNSRHGLVVADGVMLDVTIPVHRLTETAFSVATGADPAQALSVWTPPEWTEDAANSRMIQRGGASLTLRSTIGDAGAMSASGPIDIRAGAAIRVDAGQSIILHGRDFTINGTLTAPSGTIAMSQPATGTNIGIGGDAGLIWIGDQAVLDVAARAVTATDANGRRYGIVANGGSILIGGAMDWEEKGESSAPNAFVVIRPGAVLDASGASAELDIPTPGLGESSTPLAVAGNGGMIVVKSNNGLYLDGTLRAAAGGANAAGGTLALALEAANYPISGTSDDVLRHREFIVADIQGDSSIADALSMAEAKAGLVTGTARVGADRIREGGFGNLSLLVNGALSFDGNTTLTMSQSLRLYAGTFALGENASASSQVSLSAPYVRLAGVTRLARDSHTLPAATWGSGPSQQSTDAVFSVTADLIDLRDRVGFGVHRQFDTKDSVYTVDRRGFAQVDLTSRGDIRLLEGLPARGLPSAVTTELATTGNVALTAAQIYPATGANAQIIAGYTQEGPFVPGSVLAIRRYGDAIPNVPYSAFGSLYLGAETVNQGGVVRAPFGSVHLGKAWSSGEVLGYAVNLLPGSLTSVSGAGLVMPYGGTADGLVYQYNGTPIRLSGAGGMGGIFFQTTHLNVEAGAVLDLSGGGELTGAGFISGRGGSVDILNTPLVNSNPGYSYSSKGNTVYAIVPSSSGAYAPVVQETGYGAPQIGQQITIPDGVPGLPAGTYMLMPSSYALLPGAFRVELGGSVNPVMTAAVAAGNGSYVTQAYLGVANTAIRASMPNQVIITAADAVRKHSFYNEMSYNAFALADAARIGVPRAMLTIDAKTLSIVLAKPAVADGRPQLRFDGDLRIRPVAGSDGFGGTVMVGGLGEILAMGQSADPGMSGASVYADELSKLDAPRLMLNSTISVSYGPSGRFATISSTDDLIVRSGAHISAAEVILGGLGIPWIGQSGSITIEEGASISTVGRGRASYDSSDGFVFIAEGGVLALSNGWVNLMQAPAGSSQPIVNITVGGCITMNCDRTTTLVSEGTIAVSTAGAFSIANNVSYGTRNLVLGLSAINLGEDSSLAAAAASGHLPAGLALNQGVLTQLLAGNTATGAPALETLVLNARDAVNIFGSVNLDASKVDRLVLGTPAIYGYGAAGDIATIRANEFIWTGSATAPGAAMVDILGGGTLDIAAKRVVLGYAPNSRPSSTVVDNRIALGFTNVSVAASERMTSNGKSTLGVYHRQGAYAPETGYQYTGGDLTITTPLFTGEAGSVNTITAGGDVLVAGAGSAAVPKVDALGAQLKLAGTNITVDTNVVLPSGKLVLTATGDIALGGHSHIDLSGRAVQMFDVTKYSWGGDLVLTSSAGDVTQATGSVIDLSAQHNRSGTIAVTALGAGAGAVDLRGTIQGGATGQYDAGGTMVPYDAAELTVRAQTLAGFAALNERLNTGAVFGARKFQIKQGDLVVGDEVKARNVEIVVDGGDLTVNGTIDASGFQVGAIQLAAMGDLTINGTLDAHGTGMRFDSYGKIIDAPNRAIVDLTTRQGTLTLTSNAAIDLRAGTEVAQGSGPGKNDGVARGTLTLNAPRLGGTGGQGGVDSAGNGANDVAVNVLGMPQIRGAKTIAVNAFRIYDDAPLASAPDVTGHKPQEITQTYLDGIDLDSSAFIDAALGNAALTDRLSGLGSYHLRPGVEVVSKISADNPNGDLTVAGDLDLSGYRYGPGSNRLDPGLRGFGEPGVLNIRAAGNLNVRGSINDGFAPPASTPNDNGWLLENGVVPYGGDLVLPTAVTLDAGTVFRKGVTLNYDLPATLVPDSHGNNVPAGTVLPVRATLTSSLGLSAGTVVGADIYNTDGSVAFAAGTVLQNAVTLTPGMQLGEGTVLRSDANIAALIWPKGVPLPGDMTSTGTLALAAGSLIPSMTNVKLAGGQPVQLRSATGGRQGQNWAVAPMLGAGATSWSMGFVAGAELGSADVRARNTLKTGNIILADTHLVSRTSAGGLLVRLSETGVDALVAALGFLPSDINDKSELVGKSEAEIIALYEAFSWDDFGLPGFWDPSAGNIIQVLTLQGANTLAGNVGLPSGIGNVSELIGKTEREIIVLYAAFSWDDFGLPGFWDTATGNGTTPSQPPMTTAVGPSFSVVRTGTGDLDLLAAGDIRMNSLYGVYTAGTATSVDPAYNRPRAGLTGGTDYAAVLSTYQAWYPDQGGNVLIAAGGDLVGDIYGQSSRQSPSSVVTGNWLWRQGTGSTAVDATIPTSWWINFGTYTPNSVSGASGQPDLIGFTGIGTLGGGNVAIRVGGEAGTITLRGSQGMQTTGEDRSQGLVVAIGSTGRVGADGSLALTGGGDIDLRIAGALNPHLALTNYTDKQVLPGALINLRGALHVAAESIGGIKLIYRSSGGLNDAFDPRGIDPFAATSSEARSGITLVPGDSAVYLETLGDLVLGGAGDPGRSQSQNRSGISAGGTSDSGQSWFSLWTDHTAINLISAGGNLTPTTSTTEYRQQASDQNAADGAFFYPSIFRAAALGGSMYYGVNALPFMRSDANAVYPFVTLAPSPHGSLEMLARDSIYGGQYSFSLSGSGVALPTPFNPAFLGDGTDIFGRVKVTNGSPHGVVDMAGNPVPLSLFFFGPNSAALTIGRAPDAGPIRFYAREGDVVGLSTGETLTFGGDRSNWYNAAAPVMVRAGRDIVGAGHAPGVTLTSTWQGANSRGNLIVHSKPDDMSVVSAGRDIVYANFDIVGPGVLEISAGRNVYQADKGSITSIGPIATGDVRPGASIVMQAGVGAAGPDYAALLKYLDPANLLPAGTLLEGSGKVAKTYEKELAAWLMARDGFEGTTEQVRAHFETLAPEQQWIFLRNVYFAELTAGGRAYNDANSPRHGSYLRGRDMIATLFPETGADGKPIARQGDITMFGGSGVRTISGGDIQMLTPGGKLIIGVEGQVPPSTSGLITQGDGNIQLYSKGSILLGLSRIMTTYGGGILAWSSDGDINAGRGAKTTIVYTPPKRVYDDYGNVTLSPNTPSSGAGIATLSQIPGRPAGNVDLIAPLGTIDAGEAGIRSSGNVNLAALHIVNAANIQAQGATTGVPQVQAPNIGGLTEASNTAGAAAQQAVTPGQGSGNAQPSIIIVEVLGFGGTGDQPAGEDDKQRRSRPKDQQGYDPNSMFQVVGSGELSEDQKRNFVGEQRNGTPMR